MDVRHGTRSLAARPTFTLTAMFTLALGLGVTTAVTSVVHTVVVAPVPYADAGTLVQIARTAEGRRGLQLPAPETRAIMDGATTLETVGVARFRDVVLGGSAAPERVRGVIVTARTLRMLGVAPVAGRLPDDADDVAGGACVVVLSHGVAATRFAAADVVGDDVRIDGAPCTVAAVMPEGFAFPAPYFAPGDVWLLAEPSGVDWTAATGPGFLVFGRLAPGGGTAVVNAALDAVAARVAADRPDRRDARFVALAYAQSSREASRRRLTVLLAAAALVLVIACVNVVNLQLGRSAERHREMATRSALGANRARLVRQLVTENLILFVAAGSAGLVVAAWSLNVIVGLRSYFIPRMEEATIDGVAIAVCFGLALIAGLGAGLYPALRASDVDTTRSAVRGDRGHTGGPRWRRFQRTLVALETTLALVLLAGASLLLESYGRLTTIDPGFSAASVLHARMTPLDGRYADDRVRAAFYTRISDGIAAVPGVLDVALTTVPPGVGAGAEQPFVVAGATSPVGAWPRAALRAVTDSYFRTLQIPLLRGGFEGRAGEARSALVNQEFVRRYLGAGDPIGQRLHLVSTARAEAPDEESWTIVGVVADAREEYTYRPSPPTVYVRLSDRPPASVAILVRSAVPPLTLATAVQSAVASIDPDQPIYGLRELEYLTASELDLNRLALTLLAIFAGVALALAIAGISGVVSQSVGGRLREIGVRMALGAVARDVLRLIVGDVARHAALGIAAGLALAFTLAGRLSGLTPGGIRLDWRILLGAALVVLTSALLSAWLPARRAASLEPLQALRQD